MRFGKKQKIALIFSLFFVIAGLIYAYYHTALLKPFLKRPKEYLESTTSVNVNVEEKTRCPFCGREVEKESLSKPIAVIFDNHLSALPHTGISKACLVVETLAEGGITRIEAFYAHNLPKVAGPIRSARIYFVDLALSYNALLVHCGGSPESLKLLKNLPMDLDQIRFPKPFFRDRRKKAPHNLYGNFPKIIEQAKTLKYDLRPQTNPFFIFDDWLQPPLKPAKKIRVSFGSKAYSVTWVYDEARQIYLRYTQKGAYLDTENKNPPPVSTLVILKSEMKVKDPKGRLDISLCGKNKAWFFYKGGLIEGYYEKLPGKPFIFKDEKGAQISLPPGQIWIEILPQNQLPAIES